MSHDHVSFSQAELGYRRDSGYPPFSHAATIRVDGKNPGDVQRVITQYADVLKRFATDSIIGCPRTAPAALERLRGRTRWAMLVMAKERRQLHAGLAQLPRDPKQLPSDIRVGIDVDPYDLL